MPFCTPAAQCCMAQFAQRSCDGAFGLYLTGTKLKLLVLDGLMNKQQTGRSFRNFGTDEISHQHEWVSLLFTLPFSHPSGGI